MQFLYFIYMISFICPGLLGTPGLQRNKSQPLSPESPPYLGYSENPKQTRSATRGYGLRQRDQELLPCPPAIELGS